MREREALRRLAECIPASGIGDDGAVIPFGKTHLILTVDMLHRRADFPEGATPYAIGWRSAAVSLSDLAAMGALPLAVMVAYGAPRFGRAELEETVRGVWDCCRRCDADYLGGDLDRHEELTVVSAALGEAARPVTRKGAQAGEVVGVTGALGRTAAALRLFERGRLEEANALFRFPPRVREGLALAPFVTAMMDVSDGLARSLHQLAEASGVGFSIVYEEIPFTEELRPVCRDEEELLEAALYTGEDFELVFALPERHLAQAQAVCAFRVIGEVTSKGVVLRRAGRTHPLEDRGYEH